MQHFSSTRKFISNNQIKPAFHILQSEKSSPPFRTPSPFVYVRKANEISTSKSIPQPNSFTQPRQSRFKFIRSVPTLSSICSTASQRSPNSRKRSTSSSSKSPINQKRLCLHSSPDKTGCVHSKSPPAALSPLNYGPAAASNQFQSSVTSSSGLSAANNIQVSSSHTSSTSTSDSVLKVSTTASVPPSGTRVHVVSAADLLARRRAMARANPISIPTQLPSRNDAQVTARGPGIKHITAVSARSRYSYVRPTSTASSSISATSTTATCVSAVPTLSGDSESSSGPAVITTPAERKPVAASSSTHTAPRPLARTTRFTYRRLSTSSSSRASPRSAVTSVPSLSHSGHRWISNPHKLRLAKCALLHHPSVRSLTRLIICLKVIDLVSG